MASNKMNKHRNFMFKLRWSTANSLREIPSVAERTTGLGTLKVAIGSEHCLDHGRQVTEGTVHSAEQVPIFSRLERYHAARGDISPDVGRGDS